MSVTTPSTFTVGQVVKLVSSGSRGSTRESVLKVSKVWKNGVVTVEGLDGKVHTEQYAADGYRRGGYSRYSYRIVALGEGETAESVQAKQEARDTAQRDAAEQVRAARVREVAEWWENEGKAMWEARTPIGQFIGEEVYVIRFSRPDRGEQYMPFIILGKEKMYGDEERVTVKVGGLYGREYEYGGEKRREVSTYSSSSNSGASLEEALYNVTH